MRKPSFILVSPGAVDGYPPVQYQARLLARAGYRVEMVTTPLKKSQSSPNFVCPGVKVISLTGKQTFSGRKLRNYHFVRNLLAARWRAGKSVVEISYDPIGVLYSDFTPFRPKIRIAHLHEIIQDLDKFRESRLKRSLSQFNLVVVPDEGRARHTAQVLKLEATPLVVENYPLLAATPFPRKNTDRFEVVYCGSLGLHQKIDVLIRSVRLWPPNAHLVLIGNDQTHISASLRTIVANENVADKVQFLGWMQTAEAEKRLACSDLAVALLDGTMEQWNTALGASNKRFQYMKAGLPQIGDQCSGVPELIAGNGIGACLTAHDPDEIAALVTSYVYDPERCRTEGERAFALHQNTYNYEAVFKRLLHKLEDISAL